MEFLPPPQLLGQVDYSLIQLKADALVDPADIGCNGGMDDCFRASVPVFFDYVGTNPASFSVCSMTITGEIEAVNDDPGIEIDYSLSNQSGCEGNFDFDATATNNQFTYTIGSGAIDFDENANDPEFVLFVKARPGEVFDVVINSVTLVEPNCTTTHEFGSGQIFDGVNANTKGTPSACTNDAVEFVLDTDSPGADATTVIPLDITHSLTPPTILNLKEYDLEIVVEDVYGNLENVTFLDDADNFFEVEEITVSQGDYYSYLRSADNANEEFSNGEKLGEIILHHPTVTDVEAEARIWIREPRTHNVTGSTDECCSPDVSHDVTSKKTVTINSSGNAPCDDFELTYEYEFKDVTSCGTQEVTLEVFLNSTITTTLDRYLVGVEFLTSGTGTVTITAVDPPPSPFICPGNSCYPELTDCEAIDNTNLTASFGFCYVTGGYPVSSTAPLAISITLEIGNDACIDGFNFTRADIRDDVSGNRCSPTYTNDEEGFCFSTLTGTVTTENDDEVSHIPLYIFEECALGYNDLAAATGDGICTGDYSTCLFYCDEFRVEVYGEQPSENDYPICCGVTTWDLVLIQRHILNVDPLDSPYQLIAADANDSESISTLDLVAIRKVILKLKGDFPNNTSWRYVGASYVFPDPTDPWSPAFEEFEEVDLSQSTTADLVAVKIGDVNGSCVACSDDVNESPIALRVKAGDTSYQQGDTISVTFQTDSTYQLTAFQAGFAYTRDSINYLRTICPALASFGQVNCSNHPTQDEIRVLNYASDGADHTFTDSTTLFTLQFIAQQDIDSVSKFLSLDNSVLASAGYDTSATQYNMSLRFVDTAQIRSTTELATTPPLKLGLFPNPAHESLTLQVDNFPGGDFDLLIYDLTGRQMLHTQGNRDPGLQAWTIDRMDSWPGGIYLLQLRHEQGQEVVKFLKE